MTQGERADLLRLSRRLDWRFLLPSPELGRVAYRGSDIELIEALDAFSDTFGVLADGDPTGDFDLVVGSSPSCLELQTLAKAIRPGGCLYAEFKGLRPFTAAAIRRSIATLERLGLGDIEAYWHFPDFSSARAIVPLSDPGPIRYALSRRDSSFRSRSAARLGRILLHAGLFERVLPCVGIVAVRPVGESARR